MTEVVPPDERTCERCGRHDIWDENSQKWVVANRDDDAVLGTPHCLHEWDINGSFNPIDQ